MSVTHSAVVVLHLCRLPHYAIQSFSLSATCTMNWLGAGKWCSWLPHICCTHDALYQWCACPWRWHVFGPWANCGFQGMHILAVSADSARGGAKSRTQKTQGWQSWCIECNAEETANCVPHYSVSMLILPTFVGVLDTYVIGIALTWKLHVEAHWVAYCVGHTPCLNRTRAALFSTYHVEMKAHYLMITCEAENDREHLHVSEQTGRPTYTPHMIVVHDLTSGGSSPLRYTSNIRCGCSAILLLNWFPTDADRKRTTRDSMLWTRLCQASHPHEPRNHDWMMTDTSENQTHNVNP